MTYEQQLQTPQWYAKRLEILKRDDYCCQDCLIGKYKHEKFPVLHVHHREYINGLMAWEYPDELLITLCSGCHARYHGHVEDLRAEREKPVFVYGIRDLESRPVKHIREVFLEFIETLRNA